MKVGSPEHIAFNARVMHGNHNNAMLIDRAVHKASYQLAVVESEAYCAIRVARDGLRRNSCHRLQNP
jgi:hypothetical protein